VKRFLHVTGVLVWLEITTGLGLQKEGLRAFISRTPA
jgi:hypothetical protein